MLEAHTIKRYGEYETVWMHIHEAGDKWTITHSRWHASGPRLLYMEYDKAMYPYIVSALNAYIKHIESYYSI